MRNLRFLFLFWALAAGRAYLVAGDFYAMISGSSFVDRSHATVDWDLGGVRLCPENFMWSVFVRLAPSDEALTGVLSRSYPSLRNLSGAGAVLERLGDRMSMRVTADSWGALLAKTKPTFAWNDGDLMWVGADAQGNPQFTLDEAFLYLPPAPLRDHVRWVLLPSREELYRDCPHEVYINNIMGCSLRAVAKLHDRRPVSTQDSGAIDEDAYAVVLASHPHGGTVYEVGWQSEMASGVLHSQVLRKLYLLRDAAGRWHFLGEGYPDEDEHGGGRESVAHVVWAGPASAPSVEVHSVERVLTWNGDDEDESDRRLAKDRAVYKESVLVFP